MQVTERCPDNLDPSSATFPSVERVELFLLSFLTEWIGISNCVDKGTTIALIFLTTSFDVNLRSND